MRVLCGRSKASVHGGLQRLFPQNPTATYNVLIYLFQEYGSLTFDRSLCGESYSACQREVSASRRRTFSFTRL